MNWILLITYLNTTDVGLKEFSSKESCDKYITSNLENLKTDPNFKDVQCFEGEKLKPSLFSFLNFN